MLETRFHKELVVRMTGEEATAIALFREIREEARNLSRLFGDAIKAQEATAQDQGLIDDTWRRAEDILEKNHEEVGARFAALKTHLASHPNLRDAWGDAERA